MKYRQATKTDLVKIEELLKENHLPYIDCVEHIDNFIILEDKGKIIGMGGIEVYGCNSLLRSIVVERSKREKGIGKDIFKYLNEKAFDLGVTGIYLLTETAKGYFEKLGFSEVRRTEVPKTILKTKQFTELCPDTAVAMYLKIQF